MPDQSDHFVLDTSAVITYLIGEAGSHTVQEILSAAQKNKCKIYLSFVTLTEVYYVTIQRQNTAAAREIVVHLSALPVEIIHSNERIALSAGRLKAGHKISLADAFVAATAIEKKATLVHKDPELDSLQESVKLFRLPYKGQIVNN
ncbi:MAG: type II toxin-antitoxin system VapC family toxin [Candidatus Omnitrophica bacterium]|nr:type II toxin-antitoxin system VapC family toxin [Candidatus Omnitrophota bacterium]